jgi:hypothetical protein
MMALVLTASIAILVPVQKDSKELTETNIARAVKASLKIGMRSAFT